MPETIHRSIDYHRVEHDREHDPGSLELALADAWEEENEPRPGVNYGYGILQDLMMNRPDHWRSPQCRLIITRRDAAVAATAVQWLGTNCGRAFLEEALKRADFNLLYPSKVRFQQQLARQERWLYDREVKLREREEALAAKEKEMFAEREAAMAEREREQFARLAEINQRAARLDERERSYGERVGNLIALLMAAGSTLFQYREPTKDSPKRRIKLHERD